MSRKILVVPCLAIGVASLLGAASAHAADEETKVGGKIYADFTDITLKNNAGDKINGSGFGVDVTRAYLTFDHKFDDIWSANVTTDFQYSSGVSATELYIKKAYIQARVSDAFIVRVGDTDTPWIPFAEGIYGFRFVEKTLTDRLGFATSADYSVNASGKSGIFNYSVSLENGNGYKNPTRSKRMDVEGRVGITPVTGLTVAVGGYSGKRGLESETFKPANTASRFSGLVGYAAGPLKVGAEFFTAKNYAIVSSDLPTNKANGFSGWASYDFEPMWGAFARFDSAKTAKDSTPSPKDTYFNAGVVSHPRKNVDIAFAYKNEKIDGVSATATHKRGEVGVWGQVSF